jgi:hypothetical protein
MLKGPTIVHHNVYAMISKPTIILFFVAITCIGIARVWQRHSQLRYEELHHPATVYNVDLRTGVMHTNKPDDVPRLRSFLGLVGMFALLLALPLLVNDITHRRLRR